MKSKKALILTVSLFFIVTAVIGVSAAYMMRKTDTLTTVLEPGQVSCEMILDDGFYVTNTGDTEVYVRAAMVVVWEDDDGGIYAKRQPGGTDYVMTVNEDDWFLGDDGYYYYRDPVAVGETTRALVWDISANGAGAPEGYTLSVKVAASAIQSEPTKAAADRWGVSVKRDGTLGK